MRVAGVLVEQLALWSRSGGGVAPRTRRGDGCGQRASARRVRRHHPTLTASLAEGPHGRPSPARYMDVIYSRRRQEGGSGVVGVSAPIGAAEQATKPQDRIPWTQLRREFIEADWTFAETVATPGGELHPYPARFIPALPAQVLAILRPTGAVLDPFCGSGTTLEQAQRHGLPAAGNDLNPIACLISRVRTGVWHPSDSREAENHAAGLAVAARLGSGFNEPPRDIPRVDHWFPEWAQAALSGAIDYLNTLPSSDPWHDRVALSISSCVVRLSRQDSDTRYAAVEKPGNLDLAVDMLARSILRTAAWLKQHAAASRPPATVLQGDARQLAIPDQSMACAIFSPPYPNAYEYWLYHKYRMYWLGHDPISVRTHEMGARPHYCRPNGLTELDFAEQMSSVFSELRRVLQSQAPVVIVIGDSVIGGRWIDNADLLETVAVQQDFEPIARCERPILRTRSSFNNAHSRGRRTEHLLLLRSPR
jgi:hypothetical protein